MTVFDDDGFSVPDPPAGTEYAVLNDSPVGEGGNEDLLDSWATAGHLADLIFASRTAAPFTLAVDAGWGMGKSSLLRSLDRRLRADPAVRTVWFNAWTSEHAGAIEGLIKSVLLSFDRNAVRRVVRGTLRHRHLVSTLKALSLVVSSVFGLGQVVDTLWRTLAVDARSRNEIKAVVHEMATAWLARGGGAHQRLLVVFIDDLDRCSDARIFEVCEAIKLYLDAPGVVFVLACDQAVLSRAVGREQPREGVRYLEKIIQVSYPIVPASAAQARILVEGYLKRSGTAHLFDEAMKTLLIERTGRNPRRIKRLINSFVLEHHVGRTDQAPADLVRLILLRHFYPEFYRTMIATTQDDLLRQFLTYHEIWEAVRLTGSPGSFDWQELFRKKQLVPPSGDPTAEDLAALERELPVGFPELAHDREFVALVRSLHSLAGTSAADIELRLPRSLLDSDFVVPQEQNNDFHGLRVLWLDDHPANNAWLAQELTRGGAQVETCTDRESALAALAHFRPTVLLSDIRRGDDTQAGLVDLRYLREEGLYYGPVYFYTGQVTPARLEHAQELGASGVTADPDELLRWLGGLAASS